MYRLMVTLRHRPEEYFVVVSVYDSGGKLVDSREYSGVKQIVFEKCKVTISKQLKMEPIVLVVELKEPIVNFRENGILYISGEG